MGRAPCCDKAKVKRGPWSPEEDETLKNYVNKFGTGGNWIALPHKAVIASNLPGRTDNDVKNHWNTKLKKKLFGGNRSSSSSSTKLNNNNNNSNNHGTLFINAPNSSNIPINCHPSSSPLPSPYNTIFPIVDDHQLYFPSFSTFLTQNTLPTTFTTSHGNYYLTNNDHSTPDNLVFNPIQLPPEGVGYQVTTTTTSCSPQEASRNISGSPSSSLTTMDHQNNYLPFPSMEDDTDHVLLGDLGFEFGCAHGHGSDIGCLSCHGGQEDGLGPSCFGVQNFEI
ncbi:hypothetical protein Ancab_022941 [Ancistrocladus abbreviatus]